MSLRALARALPLLALALVSACNGSTENNKAGPASKIVLLSDLMFTATVGTALPAPIAVRITDAEDRPVSGAIVQFRIQQGTASLSASADTTDNQGRAQTSLTVGTMAGPITVNASVTGISAATTITGVGIPGALARLLVQPKPLMLGAVGDTARLVASLADQYGNPLPSSAITWRSLDETVATVDNAGLVTGRREAASTQVIGTTSNNVADTVTVSVADPNASACATAAVTLAPGESTTMDPTAGACIRATVGSQYVAVPYFATAVPGNTTNELKVTGTGLATFTPSVGTMAGASATRSMLAATTPDRATGFEQRLRADERRELTPRIPAARRARAARTRGSAAFAMIPNTLEVGDHVTLNASGLSSCSAPINRVGRVAAISAKAVIVTDTTNPAGGFTDADYARLGAMFDTLVVPVNEQLFGAPGDMDGNLRSVIFYTNAVNQLTPANSSSYVGGFFFARDLFPRTGDGACATSNEGEIFYMLVPDPEGLVEGSDGQPLGNKFSKAFVERVTVGTVAHEYQHLINASRRLANPLVQSFEVTWLNEGLSHIAEEMIFYRAADLQPRANIGGSQFGNAEFDLAFSNYMSQNVGRFRNWLMAPQSHTPFRNCGSAGACTSNEDLATRGAAWSLLRYLADRNGPSDGDVWMRLVDNVDIGMTNLEQVFGVNGQTVVRDWSIAAYTDDYATTPAPQHAKPSWNLRTIYPGIANSTVSTQFAGTYPLLVHPLTDGVSQSLTLKGGSAAFYPFAVAAETDAQVHVTTLAGGAAPSGVMVTIVRVK